jgi:predicted unusual protein kinase regulating ubiquinone biosynthesis (AarF/ABC1/UbiB family)
LFDTFEKTAKHAASIGQVHEATLNGKKLAVKIQYPGVSDSISSDLKLVKPIATRLLNLKGKDIDKYFKEVELKLIEETDYKLELKQSMAISDSCKNLKNVIFPQYYPELSSEKILTMDWIEGIPFTEFANQKHSQEVYNQVGQLLWDFYYHQIFNLMSVHADPHPGNFIITKDFKLGVIDFGCVKVIEPQFHKDYFALLNSNSINNDMEFTNTMYKLNYLLEEDEPKIVPVLKSSFKEMLLLLGKPFNSKTFNFGDDTYFRSIFELGERLSKMVELKKANGARGPQDALYINRTCFGLYSLLNMIKADIRTGKG